MNINNKRQNDLFETIQKNIETAENLSKQFDEIYSITFNNINSAIEGLETIAKILQLNEKKEIKLPTEVINRISIAIKDIEKICDDIELIDR